MKFGYFDDENKEYVITTPQTPYPWINYLGTQDFFSLISNTAGGYSFYKDAKLRRITRFRYNNVPLDLGGGRYFYLYDDGDFWSPGFMPVKKALDFYECRHGMGYTKIKGARKGIEVGITFFVPQDYNGEVHKVTVKNTGTMTREVKLFSFVEWCLWNAQDDSTNFQRNFNTGEVEIKGSVIYHKTEYKERRDHYAFYSVNAPIEGFDTDRESFLGTYGGFDAPQAVRAGACSNSVADGWSPIASHCIAISLNPGEAKDFVFVLGYVENAQEEKWEWQLGKPDTEGLLLSSLAPNATNVINKRKAEAMIAKFADVQAVDKAFDELKEYWDKLLSKYTVKTAKEKVNRMVNIWNQYQCMVTFNMSRSASYYESGIGRGMGFRDSCQDLLGFVHLIPDRARQRIIDIASTQFEDGSAYHQYQPLTKKGNSDIGSGFNDDPLWLIAGTSAYVRESGDTSILTEMVPFDNDESLAKPLLEHLKRSFNYIVTHKGPHGLPLIGRADWNDCLNLNCFSEHPGESFQTFGPSEGPVAESVFIAGMFVKYGEEYAQLCELMGNQAEADYARAEVQKMYDAVLKDGWDGDWFVRAYDAYGKKIGSKECDEGQIYIESNGFCPLAGIGVKEGLAKKALDSVKEKLDTQYGVMILQPAYTRYHLELGEISSYPPGYKENAGIFCHNNPWVSIAETVIGRGDRAFEIYQKACPAYVEEISEIHRTEPYVYSQMVAGADAYIPGEAKNSWLTGTAAWTFVNVSQHILGVYPTHKGLSIDPCIPKGFGDFTLTRKFREGTYNIKVVNPDDVEKGVKSLTVDGKSVEGCIVPYEKGKAEYDVVVTMG